GQVVDNYTLYAAPENSLPAAPTNLTAAVASTTQINLAWTDNSSNQGGFQIRRSTDGVNFTFLVTIAADVTTYSDTGLTPGSQYYYQVAAVNAAGTSDSSNVASDWVAAPAAPTNLTAATVSPGVINLTWSINSENETGFKIERSTDGVTFTQIAVVRDDVRTYVDLGLAASTDCSYRVRATNAVGDSAYTLMARASTTALPALVANPDLVFSEPFVSKPAYLTPYTDPIFGTQITRIGADPGQSVTTPSDGTGTWSTSARHEYSNIEPWNATGSLLMIENRPGGGGSPSKLFLDGNTYQVKFGNPSNLPLGDFEYRWHPSPSHANELIVFGNTTLEWLDVVTNSVTRSWTLPFPITASGKQTTSQDGRFIALSDGTRMFVVDMDPQAPYQAYPYQRIGPAFDLGVENLPFSMDYASISSSGKYVLVHCHGDYQRVFDVDPNTLALTPRPMTYFYPGTAGTAAQGFIYNLGHPDMTLNPFDNNEDV